MIDVLSNTVQIAQIVASHSVIQSPILSSKTTVFRSDFSDSSDPTHLIRNCCMLLALPISFEIMDGFWCSRCLNDHIDVPDMMGSFSGGAITTLVVKNWTKQPWLKIENLRDFDRDFTLSRGKIWLWLFHTFFYSFRSHNATQKISGHFDQKRRSDGVFCDFTFP